MRKHWCMGSKRTLWKCGTVTVYPAMDKALMDTPPPLPWALTPRQVLSLSVLMSLAPLSQLLGPGQGNPSLCSWGPGWVSVLDFQVNVETHSMEQGQGIPKTQNQEDLRVTGPKSSMGQLRKRTQAQAHMATLAELLTPGFPCETLTPAVPSEGPCTSELVWVFTTQRTYQ